MLNAFELRLRTIDRFMAFASIALRHPDLAAEQLEEAVKELWLRAVPIAGKCRERRSQRSAEELGALIFIHPQGDVAPNRLQARLKGNCYLQPGRPSARDHHRAFASDLRGDP
jgi:predicted TIM-barrel fold metal-dependent hydrolase